MKALVLGATGLVGRQVLEVLCSDERYEQVSALVRGPVHFHHPKFLPVLGNFEKLQESAPFFQVDHVFCCLGTTIKQAKTAAAFRKVDYEYCFHAAKLAQQAGVQSFVVISAVNADAKSRLLYPQTKGQLEEDLKHLHLKNLVFVRPSFLLGQRANQRLGELAGITLSKVVGPVMRGRFAKYRPIEARDLARDMVALANGQKTSSGYLDYERIH